MSPKQDQFDLALNRLHAAGIVRLQGRIQHIRGDGRMDFEWTEPIMAAAAADPRILALLQRMVDAPEVDRVILSEGLAKWEAELRALNPGVDFDAPTP